MGLILKVSLLPFQEDTLFFERESHTSLRLYALLFIRPVFTPFLCPPGPSELSL